MGGMMKKRVFLIVLVAVLCGRHADAIHLGADDLPYGQSMEHPLDRPINEAYEGKAFFMNLGPTGIRARIDPDEPKRLKVMFVFQDADSPAKGKIAVGDHIIGANGKTFRDAHGFHRKQPGARGWQGPPFELALAIEESQGKDGKLELIVFQGGDNGRRTTVTLQLKPVGRFAPTWPWNCPRSDKLLQDLCDFMFEDGIKKGRPDSLQALLALWASGDKRAIPLVKAQGEQLARGRTDPMDGGMVSWMWGYKGIFLGEYYHAFKDKRVIPAVEALVACYETSLDWGSGGVSHRPYPAIQRRIASGGPKGYGAMAAPGALYMLAQGIFKATGLPYSEAAYQRTHQAFLQSAGGNASGQFAYGFSGWESLRLRLEEPTKSLCKSDRGIGFLCPTGMKGIGPFKVEKWTKEAAGWNMELVSPSEFPWLAKEADSLRVYDLGENLRVAYRPAIIPEPTAPYRNNHSGGGHIAPVGMGALAHFIGNKDNTSWNYLGTHMATACAYSPQTLWDGHASAVMHAFFGVLGASRADEKDFRHFLDYTKTWIILSETHDGKGLVEQPFGCQRNATCSIQRNRMSYTHVAILLLALPKRNLLITGADYAQPAGSTTATGQGVGERAQSQPFWERQPAPVPAPVPALRAARTLSDERLATLDRALLATLVKVSDAGALGPFPLNISKTQATVLLTHAAADGTLTFSLAGGTRSAELAFSDLSPTDRAVLALLVVELKPESTDAKAMAGVYMESLGRVKEADAFFEKAGDESQAKLEQLFD